MKRPEEMSNGETPDSGATESSKRKQVSQRDFIDSQKNVVDKVEDAAGARYTLKATNAAFDYVYGVDPVADRYFAIFGFHTKIGNVANTVLNDKDSPGDAAAAGDSIQEFLALVADGKWAERAPGGVGAKIDKDALCNAIVTVAQAQGKEVDQAAIRQKLEDEPAFVRTARQVPAIAQEYAKLTGKGNKTLDDLLG